jgi:hypothetical protein
MKSLSEVELPLKVDLPANFRSLHKGSTVCAPGIHTNYLEIFPQYRK